MQPSADDLAHPWPLTGPVDFRWRRGIWTLARPWYNYDNIVHAPEELRRFAPVDTWFPFLTVNNRLFHVYIGWKPLTMDDPAFPWRDLPPVKQWRSEGRLFVQLSCRWGLGAIS